MERMNNGVLKNVPSMTEFLILIDQNGLVHYL